jgi:hypothetical protein
MPNLIEIGPVILETHHADERMGGDDLRVMFRPYALWKKRVIKGKVVPVLN